MNPPVKKQKQWHFCNKFINFTCICNAKDSDITFQLSVEKLQCILKNYKVYLQKRNLWDKYNEEYQRVINRYIEYESDVNNVQLCLRVNFTCEEIIKNQKIKLYLLSKDNYFNDVEKSIDWMCCIEFVKFINLHVYNNDMNDNIEQYTKIYNEIKKSNF